MAVMIVGAAAVDFTCCRLEKGEQGTDAGALRIEIDSNRLVASNRQVWRQTSERLNTSTLIKTVQVFMRVQIAVNNMLHFGEKVRIGNLKVVFLAVRSQGMFQQNTMYGRTADGPTD